MSDLIRRLRTRADIRRQISTRKSVQEGKLDRIAALLDEAADALTVSKTLAVALEEALPEMEDRACVTAHIRAVLDTAKTAGIL